MKSTEALRILAELTADQWGMVTSAQASMHGISRLDLSRLAEAGHLERLARGIYKDSGAPSDQFDDMRAAWLSVAPNRMAYERIKDRDEGVVFAGASAARLHNIGDLWDRTFDFVTPTRRQSQRSEIHYRQRKLDPRDVTIVEGLPAMTVECAIGDLFKVEADTTHIADALRDASFQRRLDVDRLRELLAPHAQREGFRKGDGAALLERLMEIGGIDADALSERIAGMREIGSRVVAKYLDQFGGLRPKEIVAAQEALKVIYESFPSLDQTTKARVLASISPAATAASQGALQRVLRDSTASDATRNVTAAWAQLPRTEFALNPEIMRVIQNAQKVKDA